MSRYPAPGVECVRAEGPAYLLMVEHWRRLNVQGIVRVAAETYWPWWDANDYSRDAPEALPAGSCVDAGLMLGIEQRIAYREGSA